MRLLQVCIGFRRLVGLSWCKQTRTTHSKLHPWSENRGFFRSAAIKLFQGAKCPHMLWFHKAKNRSIWWSIFEIRLCSRFQNSERWGDWWKHPCRLQRQIRQNDFYFAKRHFVLMADNWLRESSTLQNEKNFYYLLFLCSKVLYNRHGYFWRRWFGEYVYKAHKEQFYYDYFTGLRFWP